MLRFLGGRVEGLIVLIAPWLKSWRRVDRLKVVPLVLSGLKGWRVEGLPQILSGLRG